MEIVQTNTAITPELRDRAILIHSKIEQGLVDLYVNMAIMIDEKLYVALGFNNVGEYLQELEISRRTAYEYAVIGRELMAVTDNTNLQGVRPRAHLAVGPKKLSDIIRYAKNQLPRLIESGEIEVDGEVLSTEDIQKTTRKELREQLKLVKEAREEASAAKSELRIKTLEAEALQRELEEARANKRNVTQENEIHECVTRAASKLHESLAEFQRIPRDAEFSEANKVEIVTQLNAAYDSIMFLRERYIALIEEFIAKS